MSNLVLQMQASIDGYVDSAVAGSRWQLWDWGPDWPWTDDLRAHHNRRFVNAGAIVLSRPMVNEGYLDHWGRVADGHPGDPDYDFARRIQTLPKYVLSNDQDPEAEWPSTTVLHGPLAASVDEVKRRAGGDLLCFGGAAFARALLRDQLVDEIELYTNPGIAGRGTSIFDPAMVGSRYRGVASSAFACGIVVTSWARAA